MLAALLREDILRFLREDIGGGDLTSEAIFAAGATGRAEFVAKEPLVCAGLAWVAPLVFTTVNPGICCQGLADGVQAAQGDVLFQAEGPVVDLLRAERVALNLAQRLCGIATLTAAFVSRVEGYKARVTDTRKTTPGLRSLEKSAVRAGGGVNHRFNLADGVLIKDNHIAACGSITEAVRRVRARAPHTVKIETEAETLEQVRECLDCGVDIILLDNMDTGTLAAAVETAAGRAILEASGGVTLENVREVAATGVDFISVGALTHSAPARDISMVMRPL